MVDPGALSLSYYIISLYIDYVYWSHLTLQEGPLLFTVLIKGLTLRNIPSGLPPHPSPPLSTSHQFHFINLPFPHYELLDGSPTPYAAGWDLSQNGRDFSWSCCDSGELPVTYESDSLRLISKKKRESRGLGRTGVENYMGELRWDICHGTQDL